MDSHEAAKAVFTRIQSVDPNNAPKIVGYILLHDQAEEEMKRLAFGPDDLLRSVIAKAKTELGLPSNTLPATNFSTSAPPLSPIPPSSPSIWSVSCSSNANPLIPHANGSFSSSSSLNRDRSKSVDFYGQSMSPRWENGISHRRGSSVNEMPLFSKGVCKNGSTCNFVHGSGEIPNAIVDSPSKFDAFELYQQEVLRSKVAQQQRLAAAQYMAGVNSPYNKLNFIQREAERSAAAAALMMEEELHKRNRFRIGRNNVSEMGGYGDSAPGSRQIYLTFPADSTFKEEDVSNYFSIYGPVQDVRIPYQQKRMFGFVTFLYPETVRIILAKGNPHFVCDSRVLVKPYKEKGKLSDKKHLLDRYEFSSGSSPSRLDREPFEMHVGPRLLNNNRQEMLRIKLEQELCREQALEFQRRRLMDLQLLDMEIHHCCQHDPSVGPPLHSASNHETFPNQSVPQISTNVFLDDALDGNQHNPTASSDGSNGNEKDNSEFKVSNVLESLSASPTQSAAEDQPIFGPKAVNDVVISTSTTNSDLLIPPASTPNMAPPKSRFVEIPRI